MSNLNDQTLATLTYEIAIQLQANNDFLVTAESCTSGWIAKLMTDIAGSSNWFDSGMAVYSNHAKQVLLGVQTATLETYGAVSKETAIEMVQGALIKSSATLALAVTGIAGPSGGTAEKPVGTVWIAWMRRGGHTNAQKYLFSGDRDAIRRQTVAAALNGLKD